MYPPSCNTPWVELQRSFVSKTQLGSLIYIPKTNMEPENGGPLEKGDSY